LLVERPDSLLVAGDIYDSANPPASAQAMFYRFLSAARRLRPDLDLVVIGGNHDSAARLDAPHPLLEAIGVHLVGGLPRRGADVDVERLLCPLTDARGAVRGWAVAMPFLRPADLPRLADAEDPLVAGVAARYAQALEAARARRKPGQALVALGHCFMGGGRTSDRSERKVLGGNQHALPVDVFPDDVAYVALGHLHLAQAVGGQDRVRYCGSPLPLSMAEAKYPHQVLQVTLSGAELVAVDALPTPRPVPFLRLPEEGPLPLDRVEARLRALPDAPAHQPGWKRPFLEVRVQLEGPTPDLRRRVEAALVGKGTRLVRLEATRGGDGTSLADPDPDARLTQLEPEAVFRRRWARDHDGDPPAHLLQAFHSLIEQAHAAEEVDP
ncbi:MAG: exonuclease SbcCD subunit D C-terminal domain-containing protein, partial [Myxococcales bacterium]|nr:exonuclease SbcCD subunit D C-terminal domain-containing protein [Myxococcales bacterium]